MTGTPEVWLGDLARSFEALSPADASTRQAIARALGLELGLVAREHPDSSPPEATATHDVATEPPLEQARAAGPAGSGPPPSIDGEAPRLLEPLTIGEAQGERPWENSAELPETSVLPETDAPAHRSLFAPSLERELLIAIATEFRHDGGIDSRALVRRVADGRPIEFLPRLRRRHLAREIQLLIDLGSGLEPFTRDRRAIVARLRTIVGESLVSVLRFRDLPLSAAGPGSIWTWTPYVPPARSSAVIAITDLGIGADPLTESPATRYDEWLRLAELLRSRSSSLLALVPYEPDRWPPALRDTFPIVSWDRTTGVAEIVRAVR